MADNDLTRKVIRGRHRSRVDVVMRVSTVSPVRLEAWDGMDGHVVLTLSEAGVENLIHALQDARDGNR